MSPTRFAKRSNSVKIFFPPTTINRWTWPNSAPMTTKRHSMCRSIPAPGAFTANEDSWNSPRWLKYRTPLRLPPIAVPGASIVKAYHDRSCFESSTRRMALKVRRLRWMGKPPRRIVTTRRKIWSRAISPHIRKRPRTSTPRAATATPTLQRGWTGALMRWLSSASRWKRACWFVCSTPSIFPPCSWARSRPVWCRLPSTLCSPAATSTLCCATAAPRDWSFPKRSCPRSSRYSAISRS